MIQALHALQPPNGGYTVGSTQLFRGVKRRRITPGGDYHGSATTSVIASGGTRRPHALAETTSVPLPAAAFYGRRSSLRVGFSLPSFQSLQRKCHFVRQGKLIPLGSRWQQFSHTFSFAEVALRGSAAFSKAFLAHSAMGDIAML